MLAWLWEKALLRVPVSGPGVRGGGAVNQNHIIKGWTQFLITQVVIEGDCVLDNTNDHTNNSDWPGPNPSWSGDHKQCSNGTAAANNALRGIWGFYKCEIFDTPGYAGAVAALGKPKLVK